MKCIYNIRTKLIALTLLTASLVGCEDYLEVNPDMGIAKDEVFADYDSASFYFDKAYSYLDNYNAASFNKNTYTHIGAISDEFASMNNAAAALTVNGGSWLLSNITSFEIGSQDTAKAADMTSIFRSYKIIRIANVLIDELPAITMTDEERNTLLGQAYFMRAWAYFQLIQRYGGMPKLDTIYEDAMDYDKPRMTYHESSDWMVSDLDQAIAMLPEEWDDKNTGRPDKLAAKAVKAMALLYDASPLMQNDLNTTEVKEYDKSRATIAAKFTDELLTLIEGGNTRASLTSAGTWDAAAYKQIFCNDNTQYSHPEHLWYNRAVPAQSTTLKIFYTPAPLSGTEVYDYVYNAPTQNMVDLYERLGDDGYYYPISDSRSGYEAVKETDMYSNREPRFGVNILKAGDKFGKHYSTKKECEISTYVGGEMYNQVGTAAVANCSTRALTSYVCRKFIWETCNVVDNGYTAYRLTSAYIRVAHLYLNYAEAAFEATGDANVKPDGCSRTAMEALNVIRNRAGIGNLPTGVDFREAYRRERAVEFMFENNRWWDIRRWMIAHVLFSEKEPIKGAKVTKSGANYTYEVIDLVPEDRNFTMRNYWYPFSINNVEGLKNLQQNPGW